MEKENTKFTCCEPISDLVAKVMLSAMSSTVPKIKELPMIFNVGAVKGKSVVAEAYI